MIELRYSVRTLRYRLNFSTEEARRYTEWARWSLKPFLQNASFALWWNGFETGIQNRYRYGAEEECRHVVKEKRRHDIRNDWRHDVEKKCWHIVKEGCRNDVREKHRHRGKEKFWH